LTLSPPYAILALELRLSRKNGPTAITVKRPISLALKLAEKGVRLTKQRLTLLEWIDNASDHLHASDLVRSAREAREPIDRATVYRTLSLLKEFGLVDELDLLHLDGAEHHYEVRQERHVHIGCKRCGRIFEYRTEWLDKLVDDIRRKKDCEVESIRTEVAVVCKECRRKRM